MITYASQPASRSREIISSPSIFGILRSVIIKDGLHASACKMPSSPFAASPTTTQPRLCQSVASTMPFRIISSSSTTSTLSIPLSSF